MAEMFELIVGIIGIVLYICFLVFVICITVLSIGLGLSIGIYPGVFYAIRNYFKSVKEEITNPFMKTVSYISLIIGIIVFALVLLFPVWVIVAIILSFI